MKLNKNQCLIESPNILVLDYFGAGARCYGNVKVCLLSANSCKAFEDNGLKLNRSAQGCGVKCVTCECHTHQSNSQTFQ